MYIAHTISIFGLLILYCKNLWLVMNLIYATLYEGYFTGAEAFPIKICGQNLCSIKDCFCRNGHKCKLCIHHYTIMYSYLL